jgi:hypothetical protein
MATRDEWYTNPRWDAATRADFDARIRRSQKGVTRARYFQVKARVLWIAAKGKPPLRRAALDLLDRALSESGGDGGVIADVLGEIGIFQLMNGDRAKGISSLRRCVEEAAPNRRWRKGEAEMLLARCLVDADDYAGAIRIFDAMYQQGDPVLRYDVLEDQEVRDSTGKVYAHPDDAAESIVVYHHAAEPDEPAVPEVARSDRTSLAALDRHFRDMRPEFRQPLKRPFQPRTSYSNEFLQQHFVPEMGAFLGRVLVNTAKGKWVVRSPLMKSRVKIKGREVNPFLAAFAVGFYEIPVKVALEQVESRTPHFAVPGRPSK